MGVLEGRLGGGPEEPPREYEEDAESAARSRRAMERFTGGAKAVAFYLDRITILLFLVRTGGIS